MPKPLRPWDDVSMDFFMALPRTQREKDAIMVVVDRFSTMIHFVPRQKTNDASYIVEIYFREIIRSYGAPKTIVSGHNSKLLSHFCLVKVCVRY